MPQWNGKPLELVRIRPCLPVWGPLRGYSNGAWLHQVVGTKVHRVLHRGFGRVLPLCGPRPNGTLTQGGCRLSTYGDGGTSCPRGYLRVPVFTVQGDGLRLCLGFLLWFCMGMQKRPRGAP